MEGNIPQQNQEKNLALERQEAVKRQNELQKEYDVIPEEDKEYKDRGDVDKYGYRFADNFSANLQESGKVDDKIETIDEYRKLATSKENLNLPEISSISDTEKIKIEKEKIESEIKKTKKDIEVTTNKLNELRSKLGMPPSEDIPSLVDKKENLGNLLVIQKDLENKLNFESKKAGVQKEENFENKQRESKNFNENIESISYGIGNFSKSLEERQSNGYNQIYQNQEVFRTLASNTPDISNFEEIKNYFTSIKNATGIENVMDMNEREDNPENMYNASRLLKQLSLNIQEFASKIQDENQKKEISGTVSSIIENLDRASSFVSRKAQALEMMKNVKLP